MDSTTPESASQLSSLRFLGAAGTVTGSKHLVQCNGSRVLLDCGLFQGLKALRLRNWEPPPLDPLALDAVILSHAHLDHAGYLPLLVKRGFRGPIYCTSGTADLLSILLADSAHLMEEEAAHANRHGYSKHHPALPLYTAEDAAKVFPLLCPAPYGWAFELAGGMNASLRRTGHILGAASIELLFASSQHRLVYSGDLGRWDRPILRDPEPVLEADTLVLESTYGNRLHASGTRDQLARVIRETSGRGGTVLIPAFAVGRVQELLWILRELVESKEVPDLPVYIDSPMALDVTEIYRRHPEEYNADLAQALGTGRSPFRYPQHHLLRTVEQSKELNERTEPMVIIAGSGMITGGRILHHLQQRLPDEKNAVLLVGYQAAGTRGRALSEGAATLRMYGRDVPVRARVEAIDGLSAHADQAEILRWLSGFRRPPAMTYLVHGEQDPAEALAAVIRKRLGWTVAVARDGETVPLPSCTLTPMNPQVID